MEFLQRPAEHRTPYSGPELYIDPFHISPLDVPARVITEVRKQGPNAGLIFRLGKIILGFPILEPNSVIAPDCDNSKRLTTLGDPVANGEIVADVNTHKQQEKDRQP